MQLHAPAETIVERITPPVGLLTSIEERTCLLQTGGDSLYNLAAFWAASTSRSPSSTRPSSATF